MTVEKNIVQQAVRYLAGVCDGATTLDGQGFNGFDSAFGKSLAEQDVWSMKQTEAALKMLKKYRGQLERAGFKTEELFNYKAKNAVKKTAEKPKRTAEVVGDKIKIVFDFDWAVLEAVKTIPGRRFVNADPRHWTAPISQKAVKILTENKFELCDDLKNRFAEKPEKTGPAVTLPRLKKKLYPFQKEGVAFIESRGGRALVGDEMGLGKTIQALAWIAMHPEKRPAIILVPAHLKLNWAQEVEATIPGKQNVQVLNGTKPGPITGDIVIVNYDILNSWLDTLKAIKAQVLIFDEAHYIKNNQAIRTKATKKLAKGIPHIIALSGTPIVNRPVEGFNIVNVIDPTIFPDFWHFAHTYCDAKHNGYGWDFTGASNKDELHKILVNSIMIRRKKADVLPDLPNKLFSFVPMEINNTRAYNKAERDFIRFLAENKGVDAAVKAQRAKHLVQIEALKQLCVEGKMKQAVNWIRDFLETNGNKLVVFAVHKTTIDVLMNEFKGIAVKVDGGMSAENRNNSVQAFQNDPAVKLFVGNIQAAGTGLTLTAASSVAFLELPWTPGELVQAEDRCHRIGQKDTVNVYYLLAAGTIEEKIARMLDSKRNVLDAVLDGKDVVEGAGFLTDLITEYREAK